MPDVSTATTQAQPDLIAQVFNSPWIWMVLMLFVVFLIVREFKGKDKAPETQRWWGRRVKRELTQEQMRNRIEMWGKKVKKMDLYRGYGERYGRVMKIEPIFKKKKERFNPAKKVITDPLELKVKEIMEKSYGTKPKEPVDDLEKEIDLLKSETDIEKDSDDGVKADMQANQLQLEDLEYLNCAVRKFGFIAYLKYLFLKRYEVMLFDKNVVTFRPLGKNKKKYHMIIDPKAYVVEDSGIWTLSTKKEAGLIDELNMKAWFEETVGMSMDYLRRLSNEHPSQSMYNEKLTHESELKEREKAGRIGRAFGKG